MPDPLNLLSKVHDTLFGRDGGPLSPLNPADGPDAGPPGNGPGPGDAGLDSLPPGLQGRDSIPYGVAKQLDLPAPPPLPGPPLNPGGGPLPNPAASPSPLNPGGGPLPSSPAAPPAMSGNAPAIPTALTPGQPVPATGGTAQPLPVQPPNSSQPAFLSQVSQAVQTLISQTLARGADPRAPTAAASGNPATANPVPPTAQAQAAQANPLQTGAPAQAPAGTTGQPVGTSTSAGTTTPAGNPAATQAAQARPGTPEAMQQQLPQGRPDAVPLQQRPEGSLLDRLMSLLRPGATTTAAAQGTSSATNAAGVTQAAAGATVATTLPLAVAPTQAPVDARGNVMLAANDRVATQRPDVTLAGVYTADGYARRLRRGSNVLSAHFSRLLMAMGLAGPAVTMRGRDAEHQLSIALQWLFWLLALVAYACLGLAMIAFLPAGSDVLGGSGRGWTTGFAIAGLVAGAGAWWFARQLSARGGNRERTPESGRDEDAEQD